MDSLIVAVDRERERCVEGGGPVQADDLPGDQGVADEVLGRVDRFAVQAEQGSLVKA